MKVSPYEFLYNLEASEIPVIASGAAPVHWLFCHFSAHFLDFVQIPICV